MYREAIHAMSIAALAVMSIVPASTISQTLPEDNMQQLQSEGRSLLQAFTRAQQAFYVENDRFATDLKDLETGIDPETASQGYTFRLFALEAPQTEAIPDIVDRALWMIAIPQKLDLKSYVSVVWVGGTITEGLTTFTHLCESDQPTRQIPQPPEFSADGTADIDAQCPPGFVRLNG